MAQSAITIKINELPSQGDYIKFKRFDTNSYIETFRFLRQSVYQSTIENQGTADDKKNATLEFLRQAFNADYNAGGEFSARIINIVPTGETYELEISTEIDGFFDLEDMQDFGNNFTFTVENQPVVADLTIDSITFSESSLDECTKTDVNILTSEQVDSYRINGGSQTNVSTNPFTINNVSRGISYSFSVQKGSYKAVGAIKTPSLFVSVDVSSSYINSPNGATITVAVNQNLNKLLFQYSLDGTNFQISPVFSGILAGNYIVHTKDQFGCSTNTPITIPAFDDGGVGERLPYSDLPSKSNSIRYAKYVDWGICSNYKNDENTLSWQLPYVQDACEYRQLFQDCDNIITQIKTNYSNIVATVIDEELVETTVEVTQKTFYTNLRDKRDARIYNISGLGLQTGIYFTSGELYDWYTGADIGDYNLNGALPAWGVIGNYVYYNNAWFLISNIIYDDSVSAYVLLIDSPYLGSDSSIIVSTVYNLEPYNIFEFTVDMSLFQDKKIQVNITQTDSDVSFPTQVYLSEVIEVANSQEGTVCIDYYNDNNTDIFYATGIKNRIRMPIEFFGGVVIGETESERTDIDTYLISSEGYEADNIAFKLMPKQMMRKVVQALSHKFVFLNDVQYVKEESPEITGFSGSNLYRLNAQMTKSNAVYTSRGIGQTFTTGSYEIPILLKTESDGFLKIKN
tara:strand:+ start:972 stop:3026 length:2055 start_codon:yes stop_codon:yes gene_type:complete